MTEAHSRNRVFPKINARSRGRRGRSAITAGTNQKRLDVGLATWRESHMHNSAERPLNYGLDWRALFKWTLVFVAFSLVSLASVVLFR